MGQGGNRLQIHTSVKVGGRYVVSLQRDGDAVMNTRQKHFRVVHNKSALFRRAKRTGQVLCQGGKSRAAPSGHRRGVGQGALSAQNSREEK